jgi:EAL domain-containing protein (putative c-di-GMP-specific phosphodiesterase class I)
MSCACISGARQVMLEFDAMEQSLSEDLSSLPHWSRRNDKVWSVEVGGQSGYRTPEDIANFLTAFLSDELLDSIACSWDSAVDQGCCLQSCSPREDVQGGRTSLAQFASKTSSPLLEILKGNQIYSHFQAVFERDAETIWGYECLMRANQLNGTPISPAQLLEWARAENLLSMLDRVCRETHLRNAAYSIDAGKKILINFMPTAIYEPAFCLRSTLRVVEKLGLDPANIVFEVVESEEVKDQDHLRKILEFYRNAGFLTALDDLGAGSSGLGLLAGLSPNLVKLDRGLVSKAATSKSYTAVVRGLVQIAHECDQWILAEGIETEQELNLMRDLGVDLFQGFYLARPCTLTPRQLANSHE